MYNPMDITRIDRQIDELQRLKANYQSMQQPQQPINNIITSQPMSAPTQPIIPLFEAKFTNENPADILIQNKTAFIDLKNGKLTIKEVDGELKEYGLILPKDEKDIRIEELETKMKKLENSYNTLLMQTSSNVNNQVLASEFKIPESFNTTEPEISDSISVDANATIQTESNSVSKSGIVKKGMFNKNAK